MNVQRWLKAARSEFCSFTLCVVCYYKTEGRVGENVQRVLNHLFLELARVQFVECSCSFWLSCPVMSFTTVNMRSPERSEWESLLVFSETLCDGVFAKLIYSPDCWSVSWGRLAFASVMLLGESNFTCKWTIRGLFSYPLVNFAKAGSPIVYMFEFCNLIQINGNNFREIQLKLKLWAHTLGALILYQQLFTFNYFISIFPNFIKNSLFHVNSDQWRHKLIHQWHDQLTSHKLRLTSNYKIFAKSQQSFLRFKGLSECWSSGTELSLINFFVWKSVLIK